jgi:hypothetical protein
MQAADNSKDKIETIFRNLSIATPTSYLVDERKWLRPV